MRPPRGSPHPDQAWLGSWLSAFRRHERAWSVAWLVGWAALLGVLVVWGLGLGGLDRAVTAWTASDPREIERAEALLAAGRAQEAALLFERLDRDHPARGVKHALDKERERILAGLGAAHMALGRKGRALRTFEQLTAFDDRNWKNHLALAEARLAFVDLEGAAEAFDAVLAIHPRHLPSVEQRVALEFDAGRFAAVPALFEAYLEAYELARVELEIAGEATAVEAPVDGRLHAFDFACVRPPSSGASMSFRTLGRSLRVESANLLGPLVRDPARALAPRAHVPLDPDGPWTCASGRIDDDGVFVASGADARLTCELPALPEGLARVRLELQLPVPVSDDLWEMVTTSYRNLLRAEALDRLRARCVVLRRPDPLQR